LSNKVRRLNFFLGTVSFVAVEDVSFEDVSFEASSIASKKNFSTTSQFQFCAVIAGLLEKSSGLKFVKIVNAICASCLLRRSEVR